MRCQLQSGQQHFEMPGRYGGRDQARQTTVCMVEPTREHHDPSVCAAVMQQLAGQRAITQIGTVGGNEVVVDMDRAALG